MLLDLLRLSHAVGEASSGKLSGKLMHYGIQKLFRYVVYIVKLIPFYK